MLDWVDIEEQKAGAGTRAYPCTAGPARGSGEMERSDAGRCFDNSAGIRSPGKDELDTARTL